MNEGLGPQCAVLLGRSLEVVLEAFEQEHGAAAETVVFAAWRAFLSLEDTTFPYVAIGRDDSERVEASAPMVVVGGPCDPFQTFVDLVVQAHRAMRAARRGPGGATASFHADLVGADDPCNRGDDTGHGRWLLYRGRRGERALVGPHAQTVRAALEAALAAPETPLRALLFGRSGRIMGGSAPATNEHDLIAAFLAVARRQPHAPAVTTPTRSWTYAECERRVRSWARGLSVGSTVAVLSDDPLVLVCGPLAALAAGARFMMLDPTVPVARTARLIAIAGADVAIVSGACERPEDLPVLEPKTLDCHTPQKDVPDHPGHLSACLTFTSGSTGFPRACSMRRDTLRRLGRCLHATFGGTRVLRIGSVAFDVFLHDLSLALGEGGTLFFPNESASAFDPTRIAALAAAWQIDHVCAVPSILDLFDPIELCGGRMPAVISVGEPCPSGLPSRFAGWGRFFDAYGCTEAGVANLYAPFDGAMRGNAAYLRPLPGVTVAVVDGLLRPLPAGVRGELAIAGSGVSDGYVGSPRDTAMRFVPDLWGAPGGRLFLTGDWARIDVDGGVSLLGRIDRQVKVLGARVDLAELDRVALEQPGVAAAAAVATLAPVAVHLALVVDSGQRRPILERRRIVEWLAAFESGLEASGCADVVPAADDNDSFAGWYSAITRQPIPAAEMREWVDATCTRVLESAPAAVLEIGCGTGTVLRRLATVCRDAWGTDISGVALRTAAARLRDPACTARVRLIEQTATDPVRPPRRFDAALFSSVVQYFPSADYLLDALRQAIKAVRAGGRIHVTDVRDLRLAPALRAQIARHQGSAETRDDRELLLDPRFFLAASALLDGVDGVELLVRGGETVNELNTYRYDVVLHVGEPSQTVLPTTSWPQVEDITRIVAPIRIVGIPNARLRGGQGEDPVHLCHRVQASGQRAVAALDLEDPTAFELIVGAPWCHAPNQWAGRLDRLASDPLHADRADALTAELGAVFQCDLPPWMRPAEIHVVERLPLLPGGKIDYAAVLSSIDCAQSTPRRLPAEREVVADLLTGLWEDVLGHRPSTQEESFFAAGGHSLQAVRLMARLSTIFGIVLPLSTLFRDPSFGALRAAVEAARASDADIVGFRLEIAPLTDRYPMTTAQARVWFLEQLQPGTPTYHMPVALRLTGTLDIAALQRAFSMVLRRHEALRAAFGLVDGQPSQWFEPANEVEVPLLADMRLDDERLKVWIRAFGQRPFALSAGRCFRAVLLQIAPDQHVFVLVLHHLVADGWSMRILTDDLSRAYVSCCRDPQAATPFAPLRFAYRDYAVSQQRWAKLATVAQDIDWWVDRLRDNSPANSLPTRPRPPVRSGRGETVERRVPGPAVQRLRTMAVASDATLYMVLLTAFAVLVARHGTDRDITIGTPVANRPDRHLDEIVGFFANTIALRLDVALSATFRRLLTHVREVVVAAFDHQDCAFDRVVAALQPARDLSITPVFQLWFAFLDMELLEEAIGDLHIEPVSMGEGHAQFDLSLSITLTPQGLVCALTYDAALFERSYVQRMADRYSLILNAFLAEPEIAVGDIALLTMAETAALRDLTYGGPSTAHSGGVSGRLVAYAAQRPDAVAISDGDALCSYATLDALVNRLAAGLIASADRQRPVGLHLPRSFRLLALVLAALRAGVPFVLLDPDYPTELRDTMCRDAKISRVIEAADWDGLTTTQVDPMHVDLPNSALAYICFTSGSTGRPKGVAVSHGAINTMLGAMASSLSAGTHTAMLALTALSFDIALLELLLPLCVGGRVVISRPNGPFDARSVVDLIEHEAVNTIQCTPSVWRLLLAAGFEGDKEKVLLSGGEVLPPDLAGELLNRCGRLLNAYGPTEATVWSTVHPVAASDLTGAIPIGRPIEGTRCYILDERRNPVFEGVVGELYLAGAGVADGYVGRPSETATRFVPEPGMATGARMYATGDMVRWSADGVMHYVGRHDGQIKLRGVRIEPSGIERLLLELDCIDDACVFVDGQGPAARLVACCVSRDPTLTLADVRRLTGAVLPASLLPEHLVLLDALPRRPNGKRDLSALVNLARQQGRRHADGARSEVLAGVIALCAEILDYPAARAQDHFFSDLGGHSLLALRLVEGIERRFGVCLPLRALFENPTVEGISRQVAAALEMATLSRAT